MSDYEQLVKALRMCMERTCPFCDFFDGNGCKLGGYMNITLNAADAIEAMQKDLTALQKCYEIADATVDDVLNKLPKRGKWELIDGAEPMRWGCSRCKYLSWETSNYCPRCGAKMEVQDA